MKKIILGSFMMLSGTVSAAILLAGTMATGFVHNGAYSYSWSLESYNLMPALIVFIITAIVGLSLGIWGLFEKNDR